ncbi:xylulokinase [Roseomonas sp. BN140053]|uniref:xylulokinase n=1 Tax=Roseomonas sp. BN140053 TaxID=3391898 RepID=UPI0039EB8DFC
MSLVLACDLGSSSFRAALLDAAGHVRWQHQAPARLPVEGERSEIDPEDWWRLLQDAARVLEDAAGAAFEAVRAVAICGITRTQVFLDRDGRVLRPAITWADRRAAGVAEALAATLPADWPETAQLNAFHPAARLAWLREREPERFGRLGAVLDPKDFLNFRLTGRMATDRVSGARLAAAAAPDTRGGRLLDRLGLGAGVVVPELLPTAQLGTVREGLPGALGQLAGRAVFSLSNDTWAAVVGLGAMRPGLAYNIAGTTEVFGVIGAEAAVAPGLPSVDWGERAQQLGGPSQSGGDGIAWVLDLLAGAGGRDAAAAAGPDAGAALDRLLAGPRDAAPAIFLPFLQGERTPFWDPALRGAFLGLNRRHGPTDLAFAVLEGLACLNRTVLERAEAALGQRVAEIRIGGGGAGNPAWCGIKADLCGRPVIVGEAAEPGLLGAAAVAWTGLGAFPDLAAAQAVLVRVARRHAPDPVRHAAYAPLFAAWTAAVAAARPLAPALAALRTPPRLDPSPN